MAWFEEKKRLVLHLFGTGVAGDHNDREVSKFEVVGKIEELIVGEPWVEYATWPWLDNVIDWSEERFRSITFFEELQLTSMTFLKHDVSEAQRFWKIVSVKYYFRDIISQKHDKN